LDGFSEDDCTLEIMKIVSKDNNRMNPDIFGAAIRVC